MINQAKILHFGSAYAFGAARVFGNKNTNTDIGSKLNSIRHSATCHGTFARRKFLDVTSDVL
jgi:hypothetical protein